MVELTKEQKRQIVDNRRLIVSRNIFELEVDIVVMNTQGRSEDVLALNKRIEELKLTDLALQELAATL